MAISEIEEIISTLNNLGYKTTVGIFKARKDGIITINEYDYIVQYYLQRTPIRLIGVPS